MLVQTMRVFTETVSISIFSVDLHLMLLVCLRFLQHNYIDELGHTASIERTATKLE